MYKYVLLTAALLALSLSFAHDHQTVGEGENQYELTIGYVHEPTYTNQLNGLDLAVYKMDETPVENLEKSLSAAIIAPDGTTRRELPLRAVYGEPGAYTSDFILSKPGAYTFEVTGFSGKAKVTLTVPYDHNVEAAADLRFP